MSGRHSQKHKRKTKQDNIAPSAVSNVQPSTDIAESEPKQAFQEPKQHSSERGHWMKTITKPDPFDLAIWGIVLTAIIAVIYYFQLSAMRDSNEINRQSLVSVQRAFVTWKAVHDERYMDNGSGPDPSKSTFHWMFYAEYENSGATPAVDAINYFGIDTRIDETDEKVFTAVPQTDILSPVTIGPKATQNVGPVNVPESALFGSNLGDWKNLKAAWVQPHLWLWGWMIYKDRFPGTSPHLTEFCRHLLDVRVPPEPNQVGLMMGNCTRHNCTDEECGDYKEIVAISSRMAK